MTFIAMSLNIVLTVLQIAEKVIEVWRRTR
jgi:hypothetical protein